MRAYTQYAIFEGSLAELNKELMNVQSDGAEVKSVHKLYEDTYEILLHFTLRSEDIVKHAVQDDKEPSSED